jgi:hypothetical protein
VTIVKLEESNNATITEPKFYSEIGTTENGLLSFVEGRGASIIARYESLSNTEIVDDDGNVNWEGIREAIGMRGKEGALWGWELNELRDASTDGANSSLVWFLRELNVREKPAMISRRVQTDVRDQTGEERAVPPGFVHSFDACHMRQVILDITDKQNEEGGPMQFWAVHDSFGVGANNIDTMRSSILANFVILYRDVGDIAGPLDMLHRNTKFGLPLGDVGSLDITSIDDVDEEGKPLSEWFVGP